MFRCKTLAGGSRLIAICPACHSDYIPDLTPDTVGSQGFSTPSIHSDSARIHLVIRVGFNPRPGGPDYPILLHRVIRVVFYPAPPFTAVSSSIGSSRADENARNDPRGGQRNLVRRGVPSNTLQSPNGDARTGGLRNGHGGSGQEWMDD
ncbi:hypothetical protein B0H13DRAFT_1852291 [Mycena leptocephala]|nr:hypothetical protein B0H13DRAFT_1852291 [Mycena leptocephala]